MEEEEDIGGKREKMEEKEKKEKWRKERLLGKKREYAVKMRK